MLTTNLKRVWEETPQEIRERAVITAKRILDNLIHYPTLKKQYYTDDVELLAAEIIYLGYKGGV